MMTSPVLRRLMHALAAIGVSLLLLELRPTAIDFRLKAEATSAPGPKADAPSAGDLSATGFARARLPFYGRALSFSQVEVRSDSQVVMPRPATADVRFPRFVDGPLH